MINNIDMTKIFDLIKELKDDMYNIASRMLEQICYDMDMQEKKYKYYFALVNEIYKGIALCCDAIDIQAYSQIGTLLRQLLEQTATAIVIGENKEALYSYAQFARAKVLYVENKDISDLQKLFTKSKLSSEQKGSKRNFYSLGWLEAIADHISYDILFEKAHIINLLDWRSYFDNFVHTNITFMQVSGNSFDMLIEEYVYLLAIIFDRVSCSYHNLTKFNFTSNGFNVFEKFRNNYKAITDLRQKQSSADMNQDNT